MTSRKDLAKAYKRSFQSPGTDVVLKDLEAFCFQNRSTFVQGDPHATALNEGTRRVLLHIKFYLEADPNKLGDAKETE